MRVVLLHAYSSRNRGDGLLVELALELLAEALPGAEVTVVATDPASFPDAVAWPTGGRSAASRAATVRAGLLGPGPALRAVLERADLVVAVGGGYLRGSHPLELAKSLLVHGRQLVTAGRSGVPAVYLPQSIGPFPALARPFVVRALARVDRVHVRDATSAAELRALPQVRRTPDLAVLAMTRTALPEGAAQALVPGPVVVARHLVHADRYTRMVRELAADRETRWAVQSDVRGNDDRTFLDAVGARGAVPMAQLLAGRERRVVVSVRLHGAVQALLAGFPAVHLSYERKGYAAFADLGLEDYVAEARTADVGWVRAAVARIEADPAAYWARVASARPALVAAREALAADLRSAAGVPGPALR